MVRRLQPALRAAITMDSWYSALRARPFSTCCPTLRTTRVIRRARAAPRVQSSLICTGIARCTTHNASQRARENAPLVLLSSALRSSGATRARSLCFIHTNIGTFGNPRIMHPHTHLFFEDKPSGGPRRGASQGRHPQQRHPGMCKNALAAGAHEIA